MGHDDNELEWELRTSGTLEQIESALPKRREVGVQDSGIESRIAAPRFDYGFRSPFESPVETIYEPSEISPFTPSGCIYFMDGFSAATFQIHDSEEEFTLEFWDKNTSISASAPFVFDEDSLNREVYLPVPKPLEPFAYFPLNTPDRYTRETSTHLMQVISMNMRETDSSSRLLIGLPYAEEYPELFFNSELFEGEVDDGSSYGVVQSLTEFEDPITKKPEVGSNGYPARSFFAIYHLLETPVGTFFNKKATQMELQPSRDGKLGLKLPPIPFYYSLINGPIPLYSVDEPEGDPVGQLVAAAHHAEGPAREPTDEAWPWHQPDLESIEDEIRDLRRG